MPTDPHFDGATYNRSQDHHRSIKSSTAPYPLRRRHQGTARTAQIRSARITRILGEFRAAGVGPIVRLVHVDAIWLRVVPTGPRVTRSTMRMLQREGIARQIEGVGRVPGRETWTVDL